MKLKKLSKYDDLDSLENTLEFKKKKIFEVERNWTKLLKTVGGKQF